MKERPVRKYLMSWIGTQRRWMKMYRGKRYAVSCRQLGCEPTREASWREANAWWQQTKAGIDRAAPGHPLQPLLDELGRKESWARRHGLADEADRLKERRLRVE